MTGRGSERYAVAGPLIEQQPDAVLPVIRDVLAKAPDIDAAATFKAMYQLQGIKPVRCHPRDAGLRADANLPRPVTLDELAAEPIARNADPGYYTNFMNLLDYAAVSVPCGFMPDGLPLRRRCSAGPLPTNICWAQPTPSARERLPLAGGAQLESPPPCASRGP